MLPFSRKFLVGLGLNGAAIFAVGGGVLLPLSADAKWFWGRSEKGTVQIDQVRTTHSSSEEDEGGEGATETAAEADYRRKSFSLGDRLEKVTVYSDRAELTRVGKAKVPAGKHWVKFEALAPGFYPETVRVLSGNGFSGKIVQLVGEEVFSKGVLKADTRAKIGKLRGYYGDLLSLTQKSRAAERNLEFVKLLKFDAPFTRVPASTIYKPFTANVDLLRTSIDQIRVQSFTLLSKSEQIQEEMRSLQEKISLVESELRLQTARSDQDWKTSFYVQVDSASAQTVALELRYQIPNALWRPIYDVRAELDHDRGVADIRLVTAGMVEQKTGEDWSQVGVTLSSLDPVSLYLPKMNRWVLKEKRQEAPASAPSAPQASRDRSEEGMMKKMKGMLGAKDNAKVASAASAKEMRQKADHGAIAQLAPAPAEMEEAKLSLAKNEAFATSDSAGAPAVAAGYDEDSNAPVAEKAAPGGGGRAQFAAAKRANRNAQSAVREPAKVFPLDSLESIYPQLGAFVNQLGEGERPEKIQLIGDKLTAGVQRSTGYTDSMLPAVQAAGRMIEFSSPFPVDVKTNETPLKLPVHTQSLEGKLSYFAIPKNDARVYLKALTTNTTDRPILGGEAQVFMGGDLVSKTQLGTVSESAYFEVDLGVDRNVETKRIVTRTSKTSGLIRMTHQTEVNVKIELVNHHPYAIEMDLRDNYPQSPDKRIEANLKKVEPDVSKDSKAHGLIQWKVKVPAKSKKTVSFNYEVSHPENFIVSEFN